MTHLKKSTKKNFGPQLKLESKIMFDSQQKNEAEFDVQHFATAAEATTALNDDLVAAAIEALAACKSASMTSRAFCAPAGLGKSQAICNLIARYGSQFLAHGSIVVYAPTLLLAEELEKTFRATGTKLPSLVLRGRTSKTDTPLCSRSELAAKIGGIYPSTRAALCGSQTANDLRVVAPCRTGCRYWAQFEQPAAMVIFTSHAWLDLPMPFAPQHPISLRIVDESFWQSRCKTERISFDVFLEGGGVHRNHPGFTLLQRARTLIYLALTTGKSVNAALLADEFDTEQLSYLGELEAAASPLPKLSPEQPDQILVETFGRLDQTAYRAAKIRASILSHAAANFLSGDTLQLSFDPDARCPITLVQRPTLALHRFVPLVLDAPMIMIDADADPELLARCVPGTLTRTYKVTPQAKVVQLTDRSMSKRFLLDPKSGRNHRLEIMAIVAREVAIAPNHRVLLVTNRDVVIALHNDAKTPGEGEERLRMPLAGASIRWFGPSIRGINEFSSFDTVIILGRHEQKSSTIDDILRCLYGADPEAGLRLSTDPREDDPCDEGGLGNEDGRFQIKQTLIATDGTQTEVTVTSHPDPRGRLVLNQLREATTSQSVARLRLMHPSGPKRVLLLSTLPIPDLPVTELCTYAGLLQQRLSDVLDAAGWGALPLSGQGLFEVAPTIFETASSAKSWITRMGGPNALQNAVIELAKGRNLAVTFTSRRKPGQRGQPTPWAEFTPMEPGEPVDPGC